MSGSKIERAFRRLREEGGKGFIPFISAGDPGLAATAKFLKVFADRGAVVIELGVPFSDPMADGPVIQRASERALKHDFGVAEIIALVKDARKETSVPIILFSYFNPLLQYGLERLCIDAKDAGIDGFLVTDLVPEEAGEFSALLKAHGLDIIFLIAPTSSDERLKMVAEQASGFIYAVSRTGVTGARDSMSGTAEVLVERMRKYSGLPIAVGFGISSAGQISETLKYADAAVVGSAIVRKIEENIDSPGLIDRIAEFTDGLLVD